MTGTQVFFAIIGLLIPFLSVQAASMIAQRREAKMEAMKLFIKIHQDAQEFRNSMLFWHESFRQYQTLASVYISPLGNQPGLNVASIESRREAKKADASSASQRAHGLVAVLRSHCLALQLIFDEKARHMEAAIVSLYSAIDIPVGTKTHEELQNEILTPLLQNVEQAMIPVWDSFDSWKATDWN